MKNVEGLMSRLKINVNVAIAISMNIHEFKYDTFTYFAEYLNSRIYRHRKHSSIHMFWVESHSALSAE